MTETEVEGELKRLTKRFDGVVLELLAEVEGTAQHDRVLAITAAMAGALAHLVGANVAIPERGIDTMLEILKATALELRQKAVARALALAFNQAAQRKEMDSV